MKKFTVVLLAIGLLCCQKKTPIQTTSSPLVAQANAFFTHMVAQSGPATTYRAKQPKTLQWNAAQEFAYAGGKALLVPVKYDSSLLVQSNFTGNFRYHLDYLTQTIFWPDSSGQLHFELITSFPDSNYFKAPTRGFTGIRFVEDWSGNMLEQLKFTAGGVINHFAPNKSTLQPDLMEIEYTCYSIVGYNYSEDDPDDGYSWSEDGGCSVDYIGGGGGGGGAGGSGAAGGAPALATPGGVAPTTSSFEIAPPNSVIASVQNYLQCFTNVGGSDHTYTVSVCIDQPDPGTRTPWVFTPGGPLGSSAASNLVDVGHTFLILTETSGSTTITRNIGFYPSHIVVPGSPSAPGVFNDDDAHTYNVSGTFAVDNAQFFNILNYIQGEGNSSVTYNLNTYNCTTFAIDALYNGDISLPRTVGTWLGGSGNDPGDLGQDIRAGGIPGMAVFSGYSGTHPNVGQCN